MALSPSIPTSFVPKQPVDTGKRRYSKGTNLFLVVAMAFFILSLVAAGGVFLYSTYLESVEQSKEKLVAQAVQNAQAANVSDFVRLRNRLDASKQIINQHVVLSQFFNLLENITVHDVQFNNLQLSVANDRTATITMKGTAGSINALAAESTAFASQKLIKNAVFSNISVGQGGVQFNVDASLDPALITELKAPTIATQPVGTTTATTSAPIQTVNTKSL